MCGSLAVDRRVYPSGSVRVGLSLGTVRCRAGIWVDAVTGVNSAEIIQVAGCRMWASAYHRFFINAVKTSLSLRVRLKVTNEIRSDIYQQILQTNWESLAKYRSGDLLYRV